MTKKIEKIIIFFTLILILLFTLPFAYLAFEHYIIKKHWPDILLDREYLHWRKFGGNYKEEFYKHLVLDINRKKLIEGLSEKEILKKIPNLNDGSYYDPESYKGKFFKQNTLTKDIDKMRIYWLNKKDGFDWCIIITNTNIELELIKG